MCLKKFFHSSKQVIKIQISFSNSFKLLSCVSSFYQYNAIGWPLRHTWFPTISHTKCRILQSNPINLLSFFFYFVLDWIESWSSNHTSCRRTITLFTSTKAWRWHFNHWFYSSIRSIRIKQQVYIHNRSFNFSPIFVRFFVNPGSITGAFKVGGENASFVLMDVQSEVVSLYHYQLIAGDVKVEKIEFLKK